MTRVRVGVIGAGWFAAQSHIPAIAKRADVVLDTVCRLGRDELARVRDHFGFAFATESAEEALARPLDAVIVGSPHHLHHTHARAALARGISVMVDKPMTLDPREAWDLVETAQRTGAHLVVGNGWHYRPGIEQAKALLDDGAVGRIEYVLCHMASPTRKVFAGSEGLERWKTAFFRPDRATWQDPKAGGGYAWGQMSHALAFMAWTTGLRGRRVACWTSGPGAEVDLYDSAMVVFDGGSQGTLSGASALPEGTKFQVDLRVFGSEGVLSVDLHREWLDLRRNDGRHRSVAVEPGAWAYDCIGPPNALIDLAQGRGRNHSPGEMGARTVELIEAMTRSAAAGGTAVDVWRP